MPNNTELLFRYLIVFLCPGGLVLGGLIPLMPSMAQGWLLEVAVRDVTIGASVLVIFAAFVLGYVVNAVRGVLLDRFVPSQVPEAIQAARVHDPEVEAALQRASADFYPYYQASASSAIALIVWLPASWQMLDGGWDRAGVVALILVFACILFLSARDSMRRRESRINGIYPRMVQEAGGPMNGDHEKPLRESERPKPETEKREVPCPPPPPPPKPGDRG